MSNTIIYLSSSDITLRHTLDEIINLEKECFNLNDLLALKKLLDVLEEQILAEANATDHVNLVEAVQALIENINLNPSTDQEKYVDSEYELIVSSYINNLANDLLDLDAPFTSDQYDKLIKIEQSLVKSIDNIVSKNNELVVDINKLKEKIITSNKNTPELKEEAEEVKESNKVNLNTPKKLITSYENKIKAAFIKDKNTVEVKPNTSNKWHSKYNINYGTFGDDLYDLIRLTTQINNLYASLNDTSDYVALQLFANTIIETISSINNVPVENRQGVLETAIDNIANEQENEIVADKVRGFKAKLARFSSDNYQFGEEEINQLQNLASSAETKISQLNEENEEINAEIQEKKDQLEEDIATYTEKHGEEPEIDPVDENQEPVSNTNGIKEIVDGINDIIDSELPYISGFNVTGDISEIGLQEDPRLRTLTIENITPELHKEATFTIKPINENTATNADITIADNQISVIANGNGPINFKVVTGEEENKVEQIISIAVEKNNITDFDVIYDESVMNKNDERTITIENIAPNYHKDPEFSYTVSNEQAVNVLNFNPVTGQITIKATGLDNIAITISCGEINKEVNINVNKVVTSFDLGNATEESLLGEVISFTINNIEPADHRELTTEDITIEGPEGTNLIEADGIFTITYTPNEEGIYNFKITIDDCIVEKIYNVINPAIYTWYIGKNDNGLIQITESDNPAYDPENGTSPISGYPKLFNYSFDLNSNLIGKVTGFDDICTTHNLNSNPGKLYILCPQEWVDQIEILDQNKLSSIPVYEYWRYGHISLDESIDMTDIALLVSVGDITDASVTIKRKD